MTGAVNNRRQTIMKKVVSYDEVAHLWANKIQNEARNSANNFYFNGDTIYSYGYHFPIAKHHNGKILFTTRDYSVSTSTHKRLVRSAISHKDVIYCKNVNGISHTENIENWKYQIKENLDKLTRAKKPEIYHGQIGQIRSELNIYLDFFKIKLSKADQKMIFTNDIAGYVEGLKKAKETEKRKAKAYEKKALKTLNAGLVYWHDFKEKEFRELTPQKDKKYLSSTELLTDTFLRTDLINVYTSKGIKISVDVANRYYYFYLRMVKNGGCKDNCNYKMLDYEVTSVSNEFLVVGCHNIPRSEIDLLAKKLNWSN